MDVKQTMQQPPDKKYQIEISFLETADDQQVEEEIVTLLKRNFLEKVASAITSNECNKKESIASDK